VFEGASAQGAVSWAAPGVRPLGPKLRPNVASINHSSIKKLQLSSRYLRPSPLTQRPLPPWRMSARAALSSRSSPSLLVAFLLSLLSFWAFAQLSNKRLSLVAL